MPLDPNTQTFVDVLSDVKPKLEAGEITAENAEAYLSEKWAITPDEYNNALIQAKELEDKYYKFKEEHGESFLSFLPITSTYIPAHLRDKEETLTASVLALPKGAVVSGVKSAVKGVLQIGEAVAPDVVVESVKGLTSDLDEKLSQGEYSGPVLQDIKKALDPATNVAEEIGGEVLATAIPGSKIAKGLSKIASPAIRSKKYFGPINSTVSFAIADTIFTDKNQSIARSLVETFPESAPYLETLAVNPNDPMALKALKKFGEGLGIGALGETAIRGIAIGFRKLKGLKKAVDEKTFEPPVNDEVGKIKTTEIVEMPNQEIGQRMVVEQPLDVISNMTPAPEVKSNLMGWVKRNFTANQGLDPQTYKALATRDAKVKSAQSFATQKAKNLELALKKDFGVKNYNALPEETFDTISTAFGKQPLIQEKAPSAIKNILNKSKRKPAEQAALDSYIENLYASARAEQKAALDSLPEATKSTIKDLRIAVDDLSVDIKNLNLGEKINITLDRNHGLYTHTDYEAFTNPVYQKKLKDQYFGTIDDADAAKAISNLKEYGRRKAVSDFRDEVTEEAVEEASSDFVDRFMASIDKGDEGFKDFLSLIGRGSTNKNLGRVLSKRNVIPDLLKPVLKEVRDPIRIAETTLAQQGKLLAEHEFATQIKNIARSNYGKNIFNNKIDYKKGFTEEVDSIVNPYLRAIGKDANPLAGIYVNKQFKKYLEEGLDVGFSDSPIMRAFYTSNALSSSAQTVLSEATHIINIKGNFIMSFANGNLTPYVTKKGIENIDNIISSFPEISRLLKKVKGGKTYEINLDEFKKLQDLGLVDQGVFAEYAAKALDNSFITKGKLAEKVSGLNNKLVKVPVKTLRGLSNIYRGEDTIFKALNFYSELDRYKKAFPNMSLPDLEQYAATIVKDTLPTYTRIPRAIQSISRFPLIGVFPSFASESVRVLKNTFKIGMRDFLKGIQTGNSELAKIGAKRASYLLATATWLSSGEFANKEEHLISNADEKLIDQLAPTYERGSDRKYDSKIFKNPKTGNYEVAYYNTSAINPYDVPFKIIKATYAALMGKDNAEEFMEKAFNIAQPYISLSLGFEPVYKIVTGKSSLGYEISNNFGEATLDIAKDLAMPYVPRTIKDVADYIDSLPKTVETYQMIDNALQNNYSQIYRESELRGEENRLNEYGGPIRPKDKLSRLIGKSRITMDINKNLNYKTRQIKNEIGEVSKEFNILINTFNNKIKAGSLGQDKVNELYKEVDDLIVKSYDKQKKLAEIFYNFKKAKYSVEDTKSDKVEKRNFTDKDIIDILSSKGFRTYDSSIENMFIQRGNNVGIFKPFDISDKQIDRLAIKPYRTLEGRTPSDILLNIKEKLYKVEAQGIPLLQIMGE